MPALVDLLEQAGEDLDVIVSVLLHVRIRDGQVKGEALRPTPLDVKRRADQLLEGVRFSQTPRDTEFSLVHPVNS